MADRTQPTVAADPSLPESLVAVARMLRHRSAESLEPWGLVPSQARALAVLERRGDIRLGELSDSLRIAARSATDVVDGLEERGLVRRSPDPADRRATRVALTPAGRRLASTLDEARRAGGAALFDVLPASERRQLERILRRLLESGDVPPGK